MFEATKRVFSIGSGDGIVHLMKLARSNIYSDKILAPIREYITNGLDAHLEKGNVDEPLTINIPTLTDLVWSCRDYGYGLSDSDMDMFVTFGSSTKRVSHDGVRVFDVNRSSGIADMSNDSATGYKGIGCKSALAYTDKFKITSWHEGIKTEYLATVENDDRGELITLNSSASDEPSGLLIEIEVLDSDILFFERKTLNFFEHMRVEPNCNIGAPAKSKILISGTNWDMFENVAYDRGCLLVVGNIAYKIDVSNVNGASNEVLILLKENITFKCGPGVVDISASRESLEYTPKTIKVIKDLALSFYAEIPGMMLSHIMTLTGNKSKRAYLSTFTGSHKGSSNISGFENAKILHRVLDDASINKNLLVYNISMKRSIESRVPGVRLGDSRLSSDIVFTDKKIICIVKDSIKCCNIKIKKIINDNPSAGFIILNANKDSHTIDRVRDVLLDFCFSEVELTYLSDIKVDKAKSKNNNYADTSGIFFKLRYNRFDYTTRDSWDACKNPENLLNAVFVVISRFKILDDYKDALYLISNFKYGQKLNIIGVRAKDLNRIPDNIEPAIKLSKSLKENFLNLKGIDNAIVFLACKKRNSYKQILKLLLASKAPIALSLGKKAVMNHDLSISELSILSQLITDDSSLIENALNEIDQQIKYVMDRYVLLDLFKFNCKCKMEDIIEYIEMYDERHPDY